MRNEKENPSAAALALAGAFAYGTEWPSSGDVTVQAGQTWIATGFKLGFDKGLVLILR